MMIIQQDIQLLLMEQYRETPYRFVVLVVYMLTALVASIPASTFSGINSAVQTKFSLPIILVTLNTLFFPITHTLFAYPTNWLMHKYGLRVGYLLASLMAIAGVWLRTLLSQGSSFLCLLGSLMAAIGSIFIMNTPTKLAINWFAAQKVPNVAFLCVLTNLISLVLGFALPGLFVNSQSTKQDIISFLQTQAIIVSVPFLLTAALIRQKPQHPPSKAARTLHSQKASPYIQVVKNLIKNKNYRKLLIAFGMCYGINIALFSVFNQMLVGLGYKQPAKILSVMSLANLILGPIGTVLYSHLFKKHKKIKYYALIALLGTIIGFILMSIMLSQHTTQWWLVILSTFLFGLNFLPILSIFIFFAVEVTFPIEQASVAGFMLAASQIFGFVVGIVFASIVDKTRLTSTIIAIVIIVVLIMSFVVTWGVEQDLRRQQSQDLIFLNDESSKRQSQEEGSVDKQAALN